MKKEKREITEEEVREWFEEEWPCTDRAMDIAGIDISDVKDCYGLVNSDDIEEAVAEAINIGSFVEAITDLMFGDKTGLCDMLNIKKDSPRKIIQDKLIDYLR